MSFGWRLNTAFHVTKYCKHNGLHLLTQWWFQPQSHQGHGTGGVWEGQQHRPLEIYVMTEWISTDRVPTVKVRGNLEPISRALFLQWNVSGQNNLKRHFWATIRTDLRSLRSFQSFWTWPAVQQNTSQIHSRAQPQKAVCISVCPESGLKSQTIVCFSNLSFVPQQKERQL